MDATAIHPGQSVTYYRAYGYTSTGTVQRVIPGPRGSYVEIYDASRGGVLIKVRPSQVEVEG